MVVALKNNFKKYLPLFLIGLAISLIVKVPQIRDFAYTAYLEGMGLSHSEFGLVCSAGGVVIMLTYLVSGIICDRFDLRKLLVVCLLICAGCLGFMASRPALPELIIAYCLISFFGMSLFWCAAMKAICVIGRNAQGQAFGLVEGVRGGTGLFFAVLALIMLAIFEQASMGITVVLGYFAAAHVVMAALLLKYLPADLKSESKSKFSFKSVAEVVRMKSVWNINMMVFGIYTVFALLSYTGPYLEKVCGVPESLSAVISSLRVFVIALVAAPIGGALCERHGSASKVIFVGSLLCIGFLVSLIMLDGKSVTIAAIALVLVLSFLIFALKGIQFAALQRSGVSAGSMGVALGLICTVGYSGEVFLFSTVGFFLDNFDAELAYRLTFGLMGIGALIAFIGARRLVSGEKEAELKAAEEESSAGLIFRMQPLQLTLKERVVLHLTRRSAPYVALLPDLVSVSRFNFRVYFRSQMAAAGALCALTQFMDDIRFFLRRMSCAVALLLCVRLKRDFVYHARIKRLAIRV